MRPRRRLRRRHFRGYLLSRSRQVPRAVTPVPFSERTVRTHVRLPHRARHGAALVLAARAAHVRERAAARRRDPQAAAGADPRPTTSSRSALRRASALARVVVLSPAGRPCTAGGRRSGPRGPPGRPRPRTSPDSSSGRQRAGTWRGAAGRSCPQPEPWGPVARGNCAHATSCTPAQWPRARRALPRLLARHPRAAQCRAWSSAANLVVDAVAEHVADATAGVVGVGVAVDDRRDLGGVPRGGR